LIGVLTGYFPSKVLICIVCFKWITLFVSVPTVSRINNNESR